MTKEEKIKEAYGENFDRIKLHIDENGWVDTQIFPCARKGIEFEQYKKRSNTYLGFYNRPKSLKGIENNNGWTKIFSEKDLPNMLYCDVIERLSGDKSRATIDNDFGAKIAVEFYSHWKPISVEKMPVF